MTMISRDNPYLYITAVTHNRLPVFRTDGFKKLLCSALCDAQSSGNFHICAYVIMPDHIHLVADGGHFPKKVLRFANGISANKIIKHLKQNGPQQSLDKLKHFTQARRYRYSLWEHHSNVFLLTSEATFMEKVNYIHMNPVRAGLVERPGDYLWSSARYWRGIPRPDEPMKIDLSSIEWRRGAASP